MKHGDAIRSEHLRHSTAAATARQRQQRGSDTAWHGSGRKHRAKAAPRTIADSLLLFSCVLAEGGKSSGAGNRTWHSAPELPLHHF